MIADDLALLPEEARHPDVLIVGAGAVGIALGVLLARAGQRVTLIEAGPSRPPLDYRKANAAASLDLPHLGLVEGRMKALGGTTRLWGGQLMAFGENDFAAGTYPGKQGWPIDPGEMARATEKAFELLGIPIALRDPAAQFTAATGRTTQLGSGLEAAMALWLPQPDFSALFATELTSLPGLNVLLRHPLIDFEMKGTGAYAAALTRNPAGEVVRIAAPRFVLANGTFEMVGTLLRLARREGSAIAGKAHVGRWFIDHLHGTGGVIRRIDRRRLGDLTDAVFTQRHKLTVKIRLDPRMQAEQEITNVAAMVLSPLSVRELLGELIGRTRRAPPGSRRSEAPGKLRSLVMLAPLIWRYLTRRRAPHLLGKTAFLGIEVEQVACRESRIILDPNDPERIALSWSIEGRSEMRAIRIFCEAARDWLASEELGELEIDPRILAEDQDFMTTCHDAYHQMGGARMATRASDGVVDPDLKVFGTQNLYCLGAATFPSGSYANPTLTAIALAVRLAGHLQQEAVTC